MSNPPANFYARWRARDAQDQVLREDGADVPSERLLQIIWHQQRLQRDELVCLDGRKVRILHPGFKNHEAGPDFRGAVVHVSGDEMRTGDVEIDLRPAGWRAHGHDRNPAFRKVVLHVLWDGDETAVEGVPTLRLREYLDAPLELLAAELSHESLKTLPDELQGRCSAPLRGLGEERLTELLHQAASVRWRCKANQFLARARQAGWEQAFWEGIFRALGYKQNSWPMQCLAESRSHWFSARSTSAECQARLFGMSGLLPAELTRTRRGADAYIRQVWDTWWRERERFGEYVLPRQVWRFSSLRPANHPQRRLALAAHWLTAGNLIARLEKWMATEIPNERLASSLLELLQVERDDFWSWHWTVRSARLTKPQPMLGAARVTDLAVNVILPWCWTRAAEGKNAKLQVAAEQRYQRWPSGEDNSVLRLARQRLLGGAKAGALRGAAAQQGLLQILRDYCEHSNALCEHCQFPELVKAHCSR